MSSDERPNRWKAIAQRKCPRCLTGRVYNGIFKPRKTCPDCGLVFEREPGYYLGSFYISYGLGVAVGIPTVLLVLYGDLSFLWLFPLVVFWVGLFGPLIVTYSRVLWYHLDFVLDPR